MNSIQRGFPQTCSFWMYSYVVIISSLKRKQGDGKFKWKKKKCIIGGNWLQLQKTLTEESVFPLFSVNSFDITENEDYHG